MRNYTISIVPGGAGRKFNVTVSAPVLYGFISVVAATFLTAGCLLALFIANSGKTEDLGSLRAENTQLRGELERVPELEAEIQGLRLMAGQVAAMLGIEGRISNSVAAFEEDTTGAPQGWCWPVIGRISRSYEESGENPHLGIDIAAEEGALIRSVAGGVVVECGFRDDLGNFVVMDHGPVTSLYGHCREILVSNGQSLRAGGPIGRVGQTGRASGPHLHLEVLEGGMPRNPLDFLPR